MEEFVLAFTYCDFLDYRSGAFMGAPGYPGTPLAPRAIGARKSTFWVACLAGNLPWLFGSPVLLALWGNRGSVRVNRWCRTRQQPTSR
jgi:hypothetical protein